MLHRVSMPYDTNVWYHVTDASNLQSIRDHGLVPYNREMTDKVFPNHSVVENGVYLSPTIAGSQSFATSHKGNRNIGGIDNPVILKIANIDMNRLIPDPEEFNLVWSNLVYEILSKIVSNEDLDEDWEELKIELQQSGYPQFIIDNIYELVDEDVLFDNAGNFWARVMLSMNAQQRYEITQYWKEYHPTSAFVYLGTIPAQNISIASYGLYGEEPSETDIMANAYDDYQDEFAENYRFQPMFSRTANRLLIDE